MSALASPAGAALRSLAAERDRLGNEVGHHVEELDLRMKAIREQEKRMAALAAERDALTDRIEQMRDVARSGLSGWIAPSSTPLRAIEKIADAALGEEE